MHLGRRRRPRGTTPFEVLLGDLHEAGVWSDLADDQARAALEALASGNDATWAAGGAWRADGEDLADGGVEPWLQSMTGPLADCGVEVRVATLVGPHDAGSPGYTLSLNGTALTLYTLAEGQPGLPASEDPWLDCTLAPAAEVNRLLEVAGSRCRLALFWPGSNDGFAVLGDRTALLRAVERGATSVGWDARIP